MNIFLDDFTIHNDMDTSHLDKVKPCFQKCKEFADICAYMVFLGTILRFIFSEKGKLPNPKKIQAII